jgi:hypothetical protein
MIKKIYFILAILLFCLAFYETGLPQSESDYALIQYPIWKVPLIWRLTKSVAWQYLGGQLFINNESTAQGYFIESTDTGLVLWSLSSFHLDHGWNRIVFQECLANWIKAYGFRGSGTNEFLWPARLDCIAPCYFGGSTSYVYYIYVADASNDRIVKLKYRWWPDWAPDYQHMTWDGAITGGGLDLPTDLDINDAGTFYPASDDYLWVLNGQEIKRFTPDGVLRNTYGTYGCDQAEGHFCRPTAVACGRDPFAPQAGSNNNDIFVADEGNYRIVCLRKSSSGESVTWLKEFKDLSCHGIVDLEVDNSGQVWAINSEGIIYKYTFDLYPLCFFFNTFGQSEDLYHPQSFSNTGGYLDCGDVYVAESWTDSSGGLYFCIGTDILDFQVTCSGDSGWLYYVNYTLVDPSVVSIKVYNQQNQLIKTVFYAEEYSGACMHVWDGTNQSGQPVPTGDYKIVLIDSCGYWDTETGAPVNIVTKEDWVHYFTPPAAPSSLVAWQSGYGEVSLNWQDNSTNENGFTIYCDGCLCGAVGPNVTTYVDSGLVPGRSYVYWVKAYGGACESPPSNADTVFVSPFGSFSPPEDFSIADSISNLKTQNSFFSDISSKAGDTVQLRVEATTVYPGHFKDISVTMQNPVPISGFNLLMKLRSNNPDLINFHTVNISQDSILIGSDWVDYPVRECYIDTIGSLISNFSSLFSRGQPADTTLPDCKYLWVKGWAKPDSPIPASGNFRLLFKFRVDLSCISDADTTRKVYFDIPFVYFVDAAGYSLPFKYDPIGELFAWWSRPGDANNDSAITAADAVYMINYLYLQGPHLCVMEAGDADSSCKLSSADIVWIINYLFSGGPPPKGGCASAKKEENQTSTFSK